MVYLSQSTAFVALLIVLCIHGTLGAAIPSSNSTAINSTASNDQLQTWWHPTGELNTKTAVGLGNVRQSHLYDIQVSTLGSLDWYDSFVFESIPRNGNGPIFAPGDTGNTSATPDGITIEAVVGITMAWTQFLYAADAVVKITRRDGRASSTSNIVIRPTTLQYNVTASDSSVYITVPYSSIGSRFSVEFQDDLWTYRNAGPGNNSYMVQDIDPEAQWYVPEYNSDMPIVGIEPHNALLVFASAFPSPDLIPLMNDSDTYVVPTGFVDGLDSVSQSVVYFPPGVYWMTGSAHGNLSEKVNWVYLAPGAYVKGAIEYNSPDSLLKASGFGVLSGEQYVYQANAAMNYTNNKSDQTSLRMWWGTAYTGQTWLCSGPTITNPPFNTMDFNGNDTEFTVKAWDYKQTGAFFWQTDGMEIYPNSSMQDIFYHVNDDAIKSYYSDVDVQRVTVWKANNDPIIQMGWTPRDIIGIRISDLSVIHTRYYHSDNTTVQTLIGESPSYLDSNAINTANTSDSISDYVIKNLRCEGICPGLIRLNPLQNFDTFYVDGAYIERLADAATEVDISFIHKFTDANGTEVAFGQNSPGGVGLTISDWYVGETKISLAAGNWDSQSLGRLDIDPVYWGHWTII